jgi:hypothetical protein
MGVLLQIILGRKSGSPKVRKKKAVARAIPSPREGKVGVNECIDFQNFRSKTKSIFPTLLTFGLFRLQIYHFRNQKIFIVMLWCIQ